MVIILYELFINSLEQEMFSKTIRIYLKTPKIMNDMLVFSTKQ